MNVLDENVLASQRAQLLRWNVPIRQIGMELGHKGMKDEALTPFLLRLRRPAFFTRDEGFYRRSLCHPGYCLVYLGIEGEQAAHLVRALLRHPKVRSWVQRDGRVIRVSTQGISMWEGHAAAEETCQWPKARRRTP